MTRYKIQHIRSQREYDSVDYGYNRSVSYYSREEIVEMELPRSAFNELVDMDKRYDWHVSKHSRESQLRNQYPALQDAYDKYQLLLALYK